jgi:hypothetical protein
MTKGLKPRGNRTKPNFFRRADPKKAVVEPKAKTQAKPKKPARAARD